MTMYLCISASWNLRLGGEGRNIIFVVAMDTRLRGVFAASLDSSRRSVNRVCQPALTCSVQQMHGDTQAQERIINTLKPFSSRHTVQYKLSCTY